MALIHGEGPCTSSLTIALNQWGYWTHIVPPNTTFMEHTLSMHTYVKNMCANKCLIPFSKLILDHTIFEIFKRFNSLPFLK
jgi:hypothetical protein